MTRSVLIIGNFLSHANGSRGVCEDLAECLSTRGWRVVTTSRKPAKLARLVDMLRTTWAHRRAYDVAQIDLFSGPAFLWAECTANLLGALGKPFVLTLHGGELPTFAKRQPTRVRRLLRRASAVTAPSSYLREALAPLRPDLRHLHNPLDLARYPFRCRTQPQPQLVWLRALHRIYDPGLALHAVARLRTRYPGVQLVLYGPDKGDGSRAILEAEIQRLGLGAQVQWKGGVPKDRVPEVLASGDIFLNTTTIDNTPVSVLEAMACGLCVVSTDVGGIPHLIRDGREGLLVPSGDATRMAVAVERVLEEPGLAARLSSGARAAAEPCDWGAVLPQWEALLQAVATGQPAA